MYTFVFKGLFVISAVRRQGTSRPPATMRIVMVCKVKWVSYIRHVSKLLLEFGKILLLNLFLDGVIQQKLNTWNIFCHWKIEKVNYLPIDVYEIVKSNGIIAVFLWVKHFRFTENRIVFPCIMESWAFVMVTSCKLSTGWNKVRIVDLKLDPCLYLVSH